MRVGVNVLSSRDSRKFVLFSAPKNYRLLTQINVNQLSRVKVSMESHCLQVHKNIWGFISAKDFKDVGLSFTLR